MVRLDRVASLEKGVVGKEKRRDWEEEGEELTQSSSQTVVSATKSVSMEEQLLMA